VRLEHLRHLGGPNIFGTKPVSLARIELGELTCKETTDCPGFAERLLELLPGLREHHCAAGRPGGFVAAMSRGTYFGHVAEHVALELSGLAGRDVHLGRTIWAGADGRYDLIMECPTDEPPDSAVPSELCSLAITMVTDLLAERTPDVTADLEAIGRTAERDRLGPSTAAIAEAARGRDIPVRRVGGLSMLRLGYGCHRRLVSAAMAELLQWDCWATTDGVRDVDHGGGGIAGLTASWPRPEVEAIRRPILSAGKIKPRNGNHGRCITVGVQTLPRPVSLPAGGSGSGFARLSSDHVPVRDYWALVVDGRVAG
jgi:cyanophycin synthetase